MLFRSGSDLTAKKSWFLFDDEIVAIGSDINSNSGRMIETTVEQRKIEGSNTLIINGMNQSEILDWTDTIQDVEWAYLEGDREDTHIGYYFPDKATLHAKRETRTGTFHEVSLNNDHKLYSNNYLTMWLDHGKSPEQETYAYALLPGKTEAEIADYAAAPQFKVLAQTAAVHAVRETSLGMLGINFWQAGAVEYITAQTPCSLMVKAPLHSSEVLEILFVPIFAA